MLSASLGTYADKTIPLPTTQTHSSCQSHKSARGSQAKLVRSFSQLSQAHTLTPRSSSTDTVSESLYFSPPHTQSRTQPHVYDTQPLTPHAIEEWSHDVFQVGQHVRTFATEDGEWCYGQIDFHDEKQQQLGIRWYFNDTVTIMPISDFWDMEGEVIETVPYHLFTA